MDKIDTANWHHYFSQAQGTVVHESDRWNETLYTCEEQGLASGKVHSVTTPGMLLTEFCLQSVRPFALHDTQPKECAESVFILEGDVESRFSYLKKPIHFSRLNHNIQYSTTFAGNHIVHSGKFHALTITYDLSYLNALLQQNENGSLEALTKNLYLRENFIATQQSISWNKRIAEVIHAVRECPFQGATRYIFIESKMLELFVLQMEHLYALQRLAGKDEWRREDREKMMAIKEYIEKSYLQPLSLKELTLEFGINEYKLKKGYKHFFHMTVFGHILQLRMQKANELLLERQMTVADVAVCVGYNNTSSFSYEYKKQFGYSPRLVSQLL